MPRGKEPTWPVQQLILELLVIHGDQPVVIQRSLDALINQRGLTEGTPGIKWIERTIAKLQELPLDVLAKLPPSVWEKRHDYNAIRDELERSELQREQERSEVGIEFGHETDLWVCRYVDQLVVRKFGCVRVVPKREVRCEGTLTVVETKDVLKQFPLELKLHWFAEPYSYQADSIKDIITSEELCVIFAQQPAGQAAIRDPVRAAEALGCPLDRVRVIAKQESMDYHRLTPREGAWIGTPTALCRPDIDQAYLPPGQYVIRVRVKCDDGGGDQRLFTVESPQDWRDLQMMEL